MQKAEELFKGQINTTIETAQFFIAGQIDDLKRKEGKITDYRLKQLRTKIIESIKDIDYYMYFELFVDIEDTEILKEEIFNYFKNRIGVFNVVCQIVNHYYKCDERTVSDAIYKEGQMKKFYHFVKLTGMYIYLNLSSKELFFTDLFIDKEDASKFVNALKVREYINKNRKWIGLNNKKNELLAAIVALRELQIIIPGKQTPQAKIFYEYFRLSVGNDAGCYITERSLRNEPDTADIEKFTKIFTSIYQ